MKKIILTIFVLVLLIGCSNNKPKEYTFTDGFNEIMEMDKKYNANFRNERLNKTMVKVSDVDEYVKELEDLKKEIVKIPNEDTEYLSKFIIARTNMLKSQKYWQLAMAIGNRGRANDGFLCMDLVYLKEANPLFENILLYGGEFSINLDVILQERDDLKQLIGIDKTKPKFYSSPLDYVAWVIENNKKAIEICEFAQSQDEIN